MEELTDEEKVKEYDKLVNLQFCSDQPRFNQVIYQGYSLIIEKLTKIEAILTKK